ncbi:MAG: outer membrane beta-barrel protein [Sphingomonadaceae bacterium]|nr:outer membrane beta-barrel protein [Sphingomonadaceae bacterium]
MPRILLFLASTTALTGPAFAQDENPVTTEERDAQRPETDDPATGSTEIDAPVVAGTDRNTYTAADFERFSPTTALDMVRRIPGFTIQQGDDRRGLGQGGDNVLINGQRVSGKSNDAVTALGRIPAANIIRIEVRDAATLDIPGLSGQVVNIVAESTGISGSFEWNPQFRARITNPRLYTGEISVTGTQGPIEYTLGLSNNSDSFRGGNRGFEFVTDPQGNLLDTRFEEGRFSGDRPKLSGTFAIDGPGSSIGNLNLSYERFYFRGREDSDRTGVGQVDRFRTFRDSEDEWNFEIGGDFEFALGPGRLKLIGLRSFERSPFVTTVITTPADGTPPTGNRFNRLFDEGEWIGRAEYSWAMGGDWQVSVEGALNTLDAQSQLFALDPMGDFQPIVLPNSNSRVEEQRAEANITYGRPLAGNLTFQASIGGEYSELSQTGANGLTRTFYRPKGFVSFAWAPNETLDINARIEREVGQLDFGDFVASVELSTNNQNAGNPNLVPPQSWNFEVEATQQLGEFGSITAKVYYESISDIVDQVPLGPIAEAPGNLASARRYGFEWNSTFNFDPLGWRGARLDMQIEARGSRVRDPLTGENRRISNDFSHYFEIELRHDIPNTDWAWGVSYEHYAEANSFRLNQIGSFEQYPGFAGAYIEHKDVFGLRVRGGVYNLLGNNEDFTRIVSVDRRDGPIAFTEDRSRNFGPIFSFTVAGSF